MPVPTGGPGGGAGAGGIGKKDLDEYADALERKAKIQEQELKLIEKEIVAKKKAGETTGDLEDEEKKLAKTYGETLKQLRPLIEERAKELDQFDKYSMKVRGAINSARFYAETIKGISERYYEYNLSTQRAIDATGKFGGQSAQARREFESLRTSLNLTRKAAEDFGKTWAEGLKLGATTKQLEAMGKQLQAIYGQVGGIQAMKQIVAAPMGRQTFAGVTAEKADFGAILEALRTAQTPEQQEALVGRVPGEEPKAGAEAARFETSAAAIAKTFDDFQHAQGELINRGVGPEGAALLAPVLDIASNVQKIAEAGKSGWSALSGFLGAKAGAQAAGVGVKAVGEAGAAGVGVAEAGTVAATTGAVSRAARFAGTAGKLARFAKSPAGIGLIGEGVALGAEYARGYVQKGGAADIGLKHTARLGRVARYAGTGAMIGSVIPGVGTAVGGAVGGAAGVAAEYGSDIVAGMKSLGGGLMDTTDAVKDQKNEQRTLRDVTRTMVTAIQTSDKYMNNLNATLKTMPEAIEAGAARRGIEVGKGMIDRTTFAEGQEKVGRNITASISKITKGTTDEISRLEAQRDKTLKEMKDRGATDDQLEKTGDLFRNAINRQSQNMQTQLKELNVGGQIEDIMGRMETRQGQLGLEQQGAQARYQATGAVTGRMEDVVEFQQETRRTYNEQLRNFQTEAKAARDVLKARKEDIALELENVNLRPKERQALMNEAEDLKVKGEQLERNLKLRESTLETERRTAEIAAMEEQLIAHERTEVYRRAKLQQFLAKAQESFLRERGAAPEELGAVAGEQARTAETMQAKFMASFAKNMGDLNRQMEEFRSVGDEAGMLLIQEKIYGLRQKEYEVAQATYQARFHAATAEADERMKQIGIQKSALETMRDYASKTGQSWRVQMGYQSQIIQAQREDLQAAQTAFAQAKEAGMTGAPLMEKQLAVIQKQAALGEAIMGKQRDFLEKAVAQSFGMGGGTKALPNINPRIFGEIIQGFTGEKWQGMPRTIEQTRQAAGMNIRGAIGIGGGGINAAPGRPGVPPGVAGRLGAEAAQVAGGAGAGGVADKLGGVDVSGNFDFTLKSDNPMFTLEVQKIIRATNKQDGAKGAHV
jgi:hypothetical protein